MTGFLSECALILVAACAAACAALPGPSADAVVVNVSDHGIVPGTDVTLKVRRLLASLAGQPDVTLVFGPGRYDFYPDNAAEAYRAVTNHDNSLKRMAFPLMGFENFTVDGGGARFMFRGRMSPFVIDGSRGTTLKNFSIDWERPFHSELRVVEHGPGGDSFVVEIDPEQFRYTVRQGQLLIDHYDWQDETGQNVTFDPATRAPIWNSRLYGLRSGPGTRASAAGPGRVRFEGATRKLPPLGSVITTFGNRPTSRLAPAIHVAGSTDTRIQGVTVYAAGGMALIAERSENIDLQAMVVTTAPGRMVSSRADATHFLGCRGLIRLEDCRFEQMMDDGINVHGAYVKVVAYEGDNTFLCEISHDQQKGLTFAEPGDRVMLTSRETVLPLFETQATAVEVLNAARFRMTVGELPDTMPRGPLSFENLTWNPDVEMRRNVIRNNRARSALISTRGRVLIEGNHFSSQMHGVLIEGDNKAWYESGPVRDVTITRNVFENIGYGAGTGYPLYASPLLTAEQRFVEERYHRNIRFTDNRIVSFNGLLVHARSVSGLTVTGNTLVAGETYPLGETGPSVDVERCDDVTIEGNTYSGFDWISE